LPMAIPCKPIRGEWRSSSNLDPQEPLWFIVFPMAISCQSSALRAFLIHYVPNGHFWPQIAILVWCISKRLQLIGYIFSRFIQSLWLQKNIIQNLGSMLIHTTSTNN
jgi:hypothetical protein